ncbi:hypothetical protein LAL4801_06198 [Roseibium aggregatum]|uniref:Uncharacterized protein n=1 Tax=Roseibium aggregatum TaxID=187304 RepID=A0A0M6YE59_9HYPH|nr:hypothetical protein LAL4801_06198 [Roseibium aggregatum]
MQQPAPPWERSAFRFQADRAVGQPIVPSCPKIVAQDAPGDTIDHQVVRHKQKQTRLHLTTVKPDGTEHLASRKRQGLNCGGMLFFQKIFQPVFIFDLTQADVLDRENVGELGNRSNLHRRRSLVRSSPQHPVSLDDCAQSCLQEFGICPFRKHQTGRLEKAVGGTTQFCKPAQDWRLQNGI